MVNPFIGIDVYSEIYLCNLTFKFNKSYFKIWEMIRTSAINFNKSRDVYVMGIVWKMDNVYNIPIRWTSLPIG